jgi:hypothetical protein
MLPAVTMIRRTDVAKSASKIDLPQFGLGLKQVTKQSFGIGELEER